MKIIFLEGLPGSGKTSLVELFKKSGHFIVPEILDEAEMAKNIGDSAQTFFLNNDLRKYETAKQSGEEIVFIDRSPLSTVFFNMGMFFIDPSFNPGNIWTWYIDNFAREMITNDSIYCVYIDVDSKLSLNRKNRQENPSDPWSNSKSLEYIRSLYKANLNQFFRNYIELDGTEDMETVVKNINSKLGIDG